MFLGDETPNILDLHQIIVPRYASRWRDLGVQLKIPTDNLDTIAIDNMNHPRCSQRCCTVMLRRWMEITTKPTWDILRKAIDHLPDLLPNLSHDSSSKSKEIMLIAHLLVCVL